MKYPNLLRFAIPVLFLGLGSLCAQTPSFDGDWSGMVVIKDRGEIELRLVIKDGKATQYFKSENSWRASEPVISYYEDHGDIAAVGWINKGGAWTENQTFSLSWVNSRKIGVVWTRHVTNRSGPADGEAWNVRGEGTLTKSG